jgi:hypothetical protein
VKGVCTLSSCEHPQTCAMYMLKQQKKAKGPVNRATATRSPSHDSSNKKMRIGLAVGNGIHNN